MTIDITKVPIANILRPEDQKRLDRARQDRLVSEGRAARRLGFPVTNCPPFKDNDMAIDWRNGWRWEDQAIAARKGGK